MYTWMNKWSFPVGLARSDLLPEPRRNRATIYERNNFTADKPTAGTASVL